MLIDLNFKQIYFRDKSYNRKFLNEAINSLSTYIQKNNHSYSPFILFTAYNHIKTLITYYAILKAGKIAVVLDPECKTIELSEIIADVDPGVIFFLNNSTIHFDFIEEIVFRKPDKTFIIRSDLTDVCTIAYTNAEDGFSKGAMLTEKNLLCEISALIKTNGLTAHSVTCSLLPFSHLFGFVQGVLVPAHAGSDNLIIELNVLKFTDIIDEIKTYKVTHLYSVPSLYYIISKVPGVEVSLGSVRQFYSGGTKLNEFINESFQRKTNQKIREGYGLTESSPGISLNYDEPEPKENSIGKPLPGNEIKIFSDTGKECAIDEIGEIWVKGDMVFKGYFNNDKATKQALDKGWLHTGDYGKIDKEGYLYFCGLKKNMINVAGVNVYPRKLERLIKMHRNVSVAEIFSEESILQGQIVTARIKLVDTNKSAQDEFKKWCMVNINNSLLPKIWHFD